MKLLLAAFAYELAEAPAVPAVPEALAAELEADGYRVIVARSPRHARALAAMHDVELAILACAGDAWEALELVREIRRGAHPWRPDLPLVLLARDGHPTALLRAFEAGADDFVRHRDRAGAGGNDGGAAAQVLDDLEYLELRARVRSLRRRAHRAGEAAPARIDVGPLSIDTAARSVALHGRPIALRPREYALLVQLAREPTRVFAKDELLRAVWGLHAAAGTRTLDSHACRLRRKLASGQRERWIANVRSVGYRLLG